MIHGNSLRSGRRIWWVLTAVSDTSDNQTWGFKYVQNLLRIGALDSNMTVIHVQPWLSAAFLGSQRSCCLSWIGEGSRCLMVWGYQTALFRSPNMMVSQCSREKLSKVYTPTELGTLNLLTSLHDGGTYGCSWPGADVVRLRSVKQYVLNQTFQLSSYLCRCNALQKDRQV